MNSKGMRFVVDASVGIKLFINETGSDKAHALFSKLGEEPPVELFVPDLFFIECTNILLKYIRRFGRSLEDSQTDLADLGSLALKSTPTVILMEDALVLAHERNLTAYDACYAVLAKQLGVPLITADDEIVRTVDWAILLDDYPDSLTFNKTLPE
jgi:predicted nucleic acid-binding protein